MRSAYRGVVVLLVVASLLLSACGPAPTPQVVRETVVVTKEVPKEVVVTKEVLKEVPKEVVVTREVVKEVVKVVEATPVPISGVPVIVLDGEPASMNAIVARARVDWTVADEINCFLALYDEQWNLVPQAAESWDFVDDTTVRFKIRQGIKFHNGTELTAEDVAFSILAHLDPEQGSADRTVMEPIIDRVEVEDAATVTVYLKRPYAPLMDMLISPNHPILPKSEYSTPQSHKEDAVGCGPFMFKEWRKNAYIDLVAFPDYFEEGYPKVDGLRFTFLPEYGAAKSSLLAKEADAILMLNLVDVPAMARMPGIKVDSVLLMGFWYVGVDMSKEPYDNPKVRTALRLAMDRKPFLSSVLNGFGDEAFIPVPKDSPFYVPEVEYEQDIEKAKALLAEAGYPNGFKTTLTVPKTPEEEPMGVVWQSQLKAIGVTAELEVLDVPTYIDRIFNKVDFEMMICGTTAGPDPQAITGRFYPSDAARNLWKYSNPVVDENIRKAGATFDVEERKGYLRTVYTHVVEDAPMIWIARGERASAYWDHLDGFVNKPDLRYEFWKLYYVKPKK